MKANSQVCIKLEKAKRWVNEAGDFLKKNINQPLDIKEKSHYDDLVTNFDCAVQDQIIAKILNEYPKDQILAEEDSTSITFSAEIPHLWILDPIDGTTNFIVQKDHFAVMLAYFEYGIGKFGLILDVMQNKLYWCDDKKAYCNEQELKNPETSYQKSLIGVNAYMYRSNTAGLLDLSKKTLGVRITGSAGISYAELLSGKIVGYFSDLQPWDYAAGQIISEKLGFVTKNISGNDPSYKGREMVYTVPKKLLDETKKIIK